MITPDKIAKGEQLSLRDYFAGQALAGICANGAYTDNSAEFVADMAYEYADAMLEARSK